jgi:hypothetical protein
MHVGISPFEYLVSIFQKFKALLRIAKENSGMLGRWKVGKCYSRPYKINKRLNPKTTEKNKSTLCRKEER